MISTSFAEVYASMETIQGLRDLSLPMLDPDAFTYGVLAKSPLPCILLYGPPGTGKTLLVRALAKESNSTMITVSGADIRCQYVGEGEKKIQRLFAFGRKCHPVHHLHRRVRLAVRRTLAKLQHSRPQ